MSDNKLGSVFLLAVGIISFGCVIARLILR